MANEPSGAGLVILTGLTIAAVVGLYAYDAIPRRSGPAPANEIAWPQWQSDQSNGRSYDAAPQAAQRTPQESAPTDQRYPSEQSGSNQQQPQDYPQQQQQEYPGQPATQDNYPRDVPDENGAPTQPQNQQPQPNGQPQPY